MSLPQAAGAGRPVVTFNNKDPWSLDWCKVRVGLELGLG